MPPESFAALSALPDPPLDRLALAMAAEFKPVDAVAALDELDRLGSEVVAEADPRAQVKALRTVLAQRHDFQGDRQEYDHPQNSMLDRVLERRRGLPILLSIVYVEVARRAGIALRGVGLAGHYVAGHFGPAPPLLLDPFAGGIEPAALPDGEVRPWGAHETALRMLNNLVGSYARRADIGQAIRAAELRLLLPLDEPLAATLTAEARALRARLN